MLNIEIHLIPSIEKLTDLVRKSSGKVLLRLPDGSLRDIRNDEMASHFLKHESERCNKVEIHLTEVDDYYRFINFMIGGCV